MLVDICGFCYLLFLLRFINKAFIVCLISNQTICDRWNIISPTKVYITESEAIRNVLLEDSMVD